MSLFEKGTRLKLRFQLRGQQSIEDLWDLKLEDLDTLAKALKKEVADSAEESFIKKRTPTNAIAELKFEIVKHVITVKLEEAEAKADAKKKADRRKEILAILADKEADALKGKSIEELRAELAGLE